MTTLTHASYVTLVKETGISELRKDVGPNCSELLQLFMVSTCETAPCPKAKWDLVKTNFTAGSIK